MTTSDLDPVDAWRSPSSTVVTSSSRSRMDGADLVSIGLARDKAFSALVNRMPTQDLVPLVQPGAEFYGYNSVAGGRMIVFRGRDGASAVVFSSGGRRQRR